VRFVLLALFASALTPTLAHAQAPDAGVIQGAVTTQAGTVRLPGAQVIVKDGAGVQVEALLCGDDGSFTIVGIKQGKYSVSASLAGFVTATTTAEVAPGKTTTISVDLPIEGISQTVDVVASSSVVSDVSSLARSDTIGGKELDQLAPTGGLAASLRLLASIIEAPSGVSIQGGRPSQAGVQLGASTLIDPATGLAPISLPDDAIDSVAVLPNPYAVEYGRFSSGLVVIQTRRASDVWKVRFNNLNPSFRTERGSPLVPIGVGSWGPRVEVGGPLIKDRLFIEQTAQYRYSASDVPSLPQDLLRTSQSLSSFTRLDANVSSRHSLVATGGIFPGVSDQATLGTFTPPPATVDLHTGANQLAVTERALWTDTLFSETTIQAHDYETNVVPQGAAPMQLQPETTLGNFFNQQHRHTGVFQLIESLSGSHESVGGLHIYKIGFDLLRSEYDGSSQSRPVLIERTDGSLARRLDFPSGSTVQSTASTDVALFAQDRFQPATRWYVEFGVRLDRDGIVDRFNVTPRVGTAVQLSASGSAVLRGGFGVFFERTPSVAGAFDEFASALETRFDGDGVTPLGPPVLFVNTTADLQTPRSRSWDISYEQRLSKEWSLHLTGIDREGSHELIVNPVQMSTQGELLLTSTGGSSYRGIQVGVHFTRGSVADLNLSYSRSAARADLNALLNYFGPILWPVVGTNAYAPANADAPNRLLARGRLMPTSRWLLLGILDWRSGLPYSAVDDMLDFVGPRNALRFPTYARLEVGAEHRFRVFKFQPWIGVRVLNALNAFLPTDVQANVRSPAFGSFYNSEYRQLRLQVRFER
jgi:hypothetical protein